MAINILLFIIGLLLLIKGGDWFVDGSTGIARRFHMSELLIGATVVSIGTTLPEVMVSATSALGGHGEIAYGNAVGSVICNTALIAAISITVRPSKVDRKTFASPVAFFYLAAAFYLTAAYALGDFSRIIGIALLGLFICYMAVTIYRAKHIHTADEPDCAIIKGNAGKDIVWIILGAAFIAVGANLLVNNGTVIAQELGVPESVIALTFVALGTSLPELVTAVTALAKGHGTLSLGNIIGANLFNLLLVSGISATLAPFALPAGKTIAGINASLAVDLPVMMAVMTILTIPTLVRGKLSRVQGVLLLAIYAGFCIFQFAL